MLIIKNKKIFVLHVSKTILENHNLLNNCYIGIVQEDFIRTCALIITIPFTSFSHMNENEICLP
jgi:hypothetical protein